MATQQAVQNRKLNRAARRQAEREKAQRRDHHDREVAIRMTRRFFPSILYPEGPPLLALDYRYWQARRCDWDVRSRKLAVDVRGNACDPMDSLFWWWWARMVHHKQRSNLVRLSMFRLERSPVTRA